MKILWLSRHSPLDSQRAELLRLFGPDVAISQDGRPFSDASDIARRFSRSGAHELVAVAPMSVIKALCDAGLRPLWAEMEEVDPSRAELTTGTNGHGLARRPRHYRFSRFRRVTGVSLEFEEVRP